MRVVQFGEYGGPEQLRSTVVADPVPGPGEVTIEVAYAGVNFADVLARRGGYRVPALPFVPGLEVSGRVRAAGEGVAGFGPGQRVVALVPRCGGYGEVVIASAALVSALPDGFDLRSAAAIVTVAVTARALVHEVGQLRGGETVLVQGAAGGVGTAVGQIARAAGAGAVYGVVSRPEKAKYARGYGYDDVFVGEDFTAWVREVTDGRGVDLALDAVGGESWRRCFDSLGHFGRLVSYGNSGDAPAWQVGMTDLMPGARSVSGFSVLGLSEAAPDRVREMADEVVALAARGSLTIPVTDEYPLEEAAQAHRDLESRASVGKLVLRVGG